MMCSIQPHAKALLYIRTKKTESLDEWKKQEQICRDFAQEHQLEITSVVNEQVDYNLMTDSTWLKKIIDTLTQHKNESIQYLLVSDMSRLGRPQKLDNLLIHDLMNMYKLDIIEASNGEVFNMTRKTSNEFLNFKHTFDGPVNKS